MSCPRVSTRRAAGDGPLSETTFSFTLTLGRCDFTSPCPPPFCPSLGLAAARNGMACYRGGGVGGGGLGELNDRALPTRTSLRLFPYNLCADSPSDRGHLGNTCLPQVIRVVSSPYYGYTPATASILQKVKHRCFCFLLLLGAALSSGPGRKCLEASEHADLSWVHDGPFLTASRDEPLSRRLNHERAATSMATPRNADPPRLCSHPIGHILAPLSLQHYGTTGRILTRAGAEP
jgi:hypothetical protein